jgi:hypothetical protein
MLFKEPHDNAGSTQELKSDISGLHLHLLNHRADFKQVPGTAQNHACCCLAGADAAEAPSQSPRPFCHFYALHPSLGVLPLLKTTSVPLFELGLLCTLKQRAGRSWELTSPHSQDHLEYTVLHETLPNIALLLGSFCFLVSLPLS